MRRNLDEISSASCTTVVLILSCGQCYVKAMTELMKQILDLIVAKELHIDR